MSDSPPQILMNPAMSGDTPAHKKGNELQEGLKTVQQATVEDQNGNFEEAMQLYSVSLELFQTVIQNSNDEAMNALVKKKCDMYIERMEHLRLKLLQLQFPDVPEEETKASQSELDELEKQFAATPVSDNGFNQAKSAINLKKEEPEETTIETVEEGDEGNLPSYSSQEDDETFIVGPQDPEVVQGIEDASKWIIMAKEAENDGKMEDSVKMYKTGLVHLFKAYEKESNLQVKELVRVKYNCLVSRMEELENSLELEPTGAKPSKALSASIATINQYTNKARQLADTFHFTESVKYYNMAMAEIKSAMAREEVGVAKRWLAKRALVTERRIGGISAVLKVVKIALPYPWSKLFTVVEFGLRVTGITGGVQKQIDKKLSKMAGVKKDDPLLTAPQTVDLAKSLESKKKKKKKSKK